MNTTEEFIAEFPELKIPLNGVRLPSLEIDEATKQKVGLTKGASNFEFLKSLARQGLKARKITKELPNYKEYIDRAKYELDVINELGLVDYILLVWKVVDFCNKNDVPVGRSRGSVGGSLLMFLIGVTQIDSIKYELYFERFLSKTRAKKQVIDGVTYLDGSLMADVDLDLDFYKRNQVLDYLKNEFKGRTSKILTLNTLSGRLLIKECGKIVAEKPESEMTEVTGMIPKIFGQVRDIEETYSGTKDEKGAWSKEPIKEFVEWCDQNKEVYEIALKLRGLNKNASVHPSAVMISYDLIEESCPTQLSSDKESVSSYDMKWASLLNVKLDVLGLRAVSVVHDVCKAININELDIDVNDNFIYQQFQDLKTPHGLFQIEADTNLKVLQKVKPKNLEELSAVLALSRPGSLEFVDQYAKYTNFQEFQSIHPFFDDVLIKTGGVAIFQEQALKMANKIGFTLEEAEMLRKIIGKKLIKEMPEWEKKVNDKVKENNLPKEVGEIFWKILDASKNYSFNKSHAASYSMLTCCCTFLKYKYPQQFFLSLLKMTKHEPNPILEISKIEKELAHFDMKLLPPHIIKSDIDFSTEGKDIRFGLLSIKGISDKSITRLNDFRNKTGNKFEMFEAAIESGLGIGILASIIKAGALEGFKQSRSFIALEAQLWNLLTEKEKKLILPIAEVHDYHLINILKHLNKTNNDKGKPLIKDSRMGTIKRDYEPFIEIYKQNSQSEDFTNWWYEKTLLGYTYNKTLHDIFLKKQPELEYIQDVKEKEEHERVVFIGYLKEVYSGVSKAKKTKYLRLTVSDETAEITALIFNDHIEECQSLNNGQLPKEEDIVIIRGRRMNDAVFADIIGVQPNKVYMKLSQLKKDKKKEEKLDF